MRWGRIVLAAFAMEVMLIAIALVLVASRHQSALFYVIPPASLISTFAVSIWLLRPVQSRLVMHGSLVGIVGSLMYVALTRAQPEPWQYVLAHALKVIGGAFGGYVIARGNRSRSGGAMLAT